MEMAEMENQAEGANQSNEAKSTVSSSSEEEEDSGRKRRPKGGDIEIEVSSEETDSEDEFVCKTCCKTFSGYIPFKQHMKSSPHAKAILKKKRENKLKKELEDGESGAHKERGDEFFIRKPFAVCEPCEKYFNGVESYCSHLVSRYHKQKVAEVSLLAEVKENGEINIDKLKEICKEKMESENTTDGTSNIYKKFLQGLEAKSAKQSKDSDEEDLESFECKECRKVFSGLIPFIQHILSKVHHKKLRQKKHLEKIKSVGSEKKKRASSSTSTDISTLEDVSDVVTCKLCCLTFPDQENAFEHLKSKKHAKKHKNYMQKLSDLAEYQDTSSTKSESETEDTHVNAIVQLKEEGNPNADTSHQENLPSSSLRGATAGPTKSEDSTKEETAIVYAKYKEYKGIMNESQEKDTK